MACWRPWNEHPEGVDVSSACSIVTKLTPSVYFDALARDLDEATKASIYYSKGLDDEDTSNQMERRIEELEGVLENLRRLFKVERSGKKRAEDFLQNVRRKWEHHNSSNSCDMDELVGLLC